jgi:hypothetical protein
MDRTLVNVLAQIEERVRFKFLFFARVGLRLNIGFFRRLSSLAASCLTYRLL